MIFGHLMSWHPRC